MIENGFYQSFTKWTKRFIVSVWKPEKFPKDSAAQILRISQLLSVFYLYYIGMMAGLAVFILEKLCYKKNNNLPSEKVNKVRGHYEFVL